MFECRADGMEEPSIAVGIGVMHDHRGTATLSLASTLTDLDALSPSPR
jgi:hypothetical protein